MRQRRPWLGLERQRHRPLHPRAARHARVLSEAQPLQRGTLRLLLGRIVNAGVVCRASARPCDVAVAPRAAASEAALWARYSSSLTLVRMTHTTVSANTTPRITHMRPGGKVRPKSWPSEPVMLGAAYQ